MIKAMLMQSTSFVVLGVVVVALPSLIEIARFNDVWTWSSLFIIPFDLLTLFEGPNGYPGCRINKAEGNVRVCSVLPCRRARGGEASTHVRSSSGLMEGRERSSHPLLLLLLNDWMMMMASGNQDDVYDIEALKWCWSRRRRDDKGGFASYLSPFCGVRPRELGMSWRWGEVKGEGVLVRSERMTNE